MFGRRTTLLIVALAVSSGTAGDAAAQAQRAGIVTVSSGTVQVARPSAPTRPLKLRDDVFVHDRVTTGEHSLARILLGGGKALVTVSERSVITITEVPGHSIIDLATGRMSLAVARDRMKPGDSVEIRTSVAIAGVRGTVVIAEVTPGSLPAQTSARFTVLKGLVEVNALDPTTRRTFGPSTLLGAHQTLLADRRGVTPPTGISQQAAERLGKLFSPPLSDPTRARAAIRQQAGHEPRPEPEEWDTEHDRGHRRGTTPRDDGDGKRSDRRESLDQGFGDGSGRDQRTGRSDIGRRWEGLERSDRHERIDRGDSLDRLDRPERAERLERPERADRAERPERVERAERTERPGRTERPERRGR